MPPRRPLWPAGWRGSAPGPSTLGRLALILALFGLLMALRALVLWRRDTLLGRLQIGFVEAQRAKIARGLASAEWRMLAGIGHARITHLMGGDIQRCAAGVAFLLQSGAAVVMLIAQLGLALFLSPSLTALAIGRWRSARSRVRAAAAVARRRQAGDREPAWR